MIAPFRLPGTLLAGPGALEGLDGELRRMGVRRAALVTDPGLVRAGVIKTVVGVAPSVDTVVFDRAEQEPTMENLQEAVAFLREIAFEAVIGVGGGSAMDVAKLAAAIAPTGQDSRRFFEDARLEGPGLPTILIPTTAGTSAEITQNALFLDPSARAKKAVVSPFIIPRVAIVDPAVTISAPPSVTAAAGMDALAHAIESYMSVRSTPHTEMYALEAIRHITLHLRQAFALGTNMAARTGMAWGALFAGISMAHAGSAAGHALGYPLGGKFRITHGIANSMMLPYVMKFNLPGAADKLARVAQSMGENVSGLSVWEAGERAVSAVRRLAADVEMPQSLGELGISECDVPELAAGAAQVTRLLANNPRTMTERDAARVYRAAIQGDLGAV
ncbi:MAG: iron-containing alcohol dehydrogenase [Firmicutes bacterium]|jgi:alcohol dehydrogenase|nr:iron-containing alcohol dehydrogenase [Bacillota bacterium]